MGHTKPEKQQHNHYKSFMKKYGTAAQEPLPVDKTARLDLAGHKRVQQIIGLLLFYT